MNNNEKTCGIVMPISAIDNCNEEHWTEILTILKDTISEVDLIPNLVSDSDDSGVIQKRIIDNLYSNPIVVCDISGRNSNVMFELGIRLAFDKPTIIIKDDQTPFSFDTSIIEHLIYPRDLRFSQVKMFQDQLKQKIIATLRESKENSEYSTFLSHFGKFKIAKPKESEISSYDYIVKSLDAINKNLETIKYRERNEFEISNSNSINKSNLHSYNYAFIDIGDFLPEIGIVSYPFNSKDTFRYFLDSIFYLLKGTVDAFTYGFEWILINTQTNKPLKLLNSAERKYGIPFQDNRTLMSIGIIDRINLKVKKLYSDKSIFDMNLSDFDTEEILL